MPEGRHPTAGRVRAVLRTGSPQDVHRDESAIADALARRSRAYQPLVGNLPFFPDKHFNQFPTSNIMQLLDTIQSSTRRTILAALVVSAFILTGCSKTNKPEGFPDIYPCEIKVIQDGTPLTDAHVTLLGDQPWAVGGGTDANGIAKMFTHGTFEGVPVGKYKVLISKKVLEGAPTQEQLDNPSYSGGGGTWYDTVDKKFGVQTATPLEIEVKAGQNSETFDVGQAVKEKQMAL
jgi:hypothetical protein